MSDVVVIARMNNGDDVIAIIHGQHENKIKLEHPHFIRYNAAQASIAMLPYCVFSDERFFEVDVSRTEFVVVANDEISTKFLAMVNAANQLRMPEPEEIPVSDRIDLASVMQGNDTKH